MTLLRSSAVMAAGTATSRLLGFARAAVLALAISTVFGAANAFDLANKIPNNLYMLIAGGVLNAVLVPQIVRAAQREDGGREFTDRLLTVAVGALLVLTTLLTVAAPWLVRLYSQGWDRDTLALATAFALWCVPQVFFYGLYTLLGQVLNARGSFGPYMWAPVLNNVVAIAGLGAFLAVYGRGDRVTEVHAVGDWSTAMIVLVAGTATLGVVAQALVLVWPLRRSGFAWRPRRGLRGVGLGTAGRVAGWTFAGVAAGQLAFVVTSRVTSEAGQAGRGTALAAVTPGNAAYTYAFLLFMLPHSLVAVSAVTALFTRMSRSASTGDAAGVRRDVDLGLRVLALVSVPATAGLVVLGGPITWVVASGTPASGQAVGLVTSTMALGLAAFSANYLLVRAFYAFEDARTPFLAALPNLAVLVAGNLAASAFLPPRLVVAGVGLAMAAGHVAGALTAARLLRRRLGGLDVRGLVRHHVRVVVAVLPGVLAAVLVSELLDGVTWSGKAGALVTIAVAGSVLAGLYLAGLKVLRVRELDDLVAPVRQRLTRR
jgi:putative peptidoglycan lipid II flippase